MSSAKQYQDWSKEDLIKEISKLSGEFGLRFDRSKADRDLEEERQKMTLVEVVPELCVGDASQNLLIEGDNYDALKMLAVTHRGQVDCIYIDPPYNMCKKDFIYKDDFLDHKATFKHSKWLAFMELRLKLAKQVLKREGVIFVSIDDHEYHHLKMLMDQIFSVDRYIGTFVKKLAAVGKNDSVFMKTAHEYLLVYGEVGSLQTEQLSREKDLYVTLRKMGDKDRREDRPNLYYPIYCCKESGAISLNPFEGAVEVLPLRSDGTDSRWRWGREKVKNESDRLHLRKGKDGGYGLFVLTEAGEDKISPWVSLLEDDTSNSSFSSLHSVIEDFNQGGGTHLKKILGDVVFSYPKNPEYIQWILSTVRNKNAVVMDFFAGSGTTAEAVLKLNAQDGGARKFICVCSTEATKKEPNKNICRDITSLRVRKVIQGYSVKQKSKSVSVAGTGGTFIYLRATSEKLSKVPVKITNEQIWTALQLLHSRPLNPTSTEFKSLQGEFAIAFVPNASEKVIQELHIDLGNKGRSVTVYATKFSENAMALAEKLEMALHKVPKEILDLYVETV